MAPQLYLCTIAKTQNWSLSWNKEKYFWLNINPLWARVKPRRAKPKTKHQALTHLCKWKLYKETFIESQPRTTAVQLKSKV